MTSIEKLNLKSPNADPDYSKVEHLVTDTERTRKDVSELAAHISKKYRQPYNFDLVTKHSPVRPLQLVHKNIGKNRFARDNDSLRQSIYFASAVNRSKADK